MILLDTDTVSLFHAGHERVVARMKSADPAETIATTVITQAEVLRARYEFLLKASDGREVLRAQHWLDSSEALFADFRIVPIDSRAATGFDRLRAQRKLKGIGRADLLIASIALAHDATLVSRNLKHFRQVPGLRLENWAD
jgi:tRNA(fMet)-specific endonuclease VapC